MIKSTTKITVQFNDLDPMNIVWHGNYVKYLEQARSELFQKIGYDYLQMYKDNYMYPIAKMDMKFIRSASFAQELEIVTTLIEIEPAIILKYEIRDFKTKEKILSAKSMQIAVCIKTKKALYTPPNKLIQKIKDFKND